MESPLIERALPLQMDAIKALLIQNNLPVSDIGRDNQLFWCISINNQLVAAIGLELYGSAALLRSLVVDVNYRHSGWAQQLHQIVVDEALTRDVTDLYLLTSTAAPLFTFLKWESANRQTAPAAIAQSTEFSSICPSTAQFMHLSLKREVASLHFSKGMNCAQSVFTPFAITKGMDKAVALKLTTGFGSGLVYQGETCGAVAGAMLSIGLYMGRDVVEATQARDQTYEAIQLFNQRFKALHGSLKCFGLLNIDLSMVANRQKAAAEGVFQTKCAQYVADAVVLTDEIIQARCQQKSN